MFNTLKFKMKFYIISLIIGIMLFHFLFIYMSYSSIIKRDFLQKSTHFCKQIAKYIEIRLDSIEETAFSFFKKYNLEESLNEYNFFLSNRLWELSNINSDIIGAFVFNDEFTYFTDSQYQRILPGLLETINESSPSGNHWLTYRDITSSEDYLLFIQTITDNNNNSVGFLVLNVSPKSFLYLLEEYKNTFLKNTIVTILFNNSPPIHLNYPSSDELQIIEANALYDKDEYEVSSISLESKQITIHTVTSFLHIKSNLNSLKTVLIFIFLTFLLLAFICLTIYINILIKVLNNLHTKIENFTTSTEIVG